MLLHAFGRGSWNAGVYATLMDAYAHGSIMDVVRVNAWDGQVNKWAFMIDSGRIWNIVGLSVLGFVLGRVAFFTEPERYKSIHIRIFVVLLGLSIVLLSFKPQLVALVFGSSHGSLASYILDSYANISLMLLTVLGLVLLYRLPPAARVLGLRRRRPGFRAERKHGHVHPGQRGRLPRMLRLRRRPYVRTEDERRDRVLGV
jgi:hypothetical protein